MLIGIFQNEHLYAQAHAHVAVDSVSGTKSALGSSLAMPSFFYHLKFELYTTPNPVEGKLQTVRYNRELIWLPPPGTSVFDDLPSHAPESQRTRDRGPEVQTQRIFVGSSSASSSTTFSAGSASALPSVIDCGAPRAPTQDSDKPIEVLSERQWRQRTLSFPPPQPSAAIHPQKAIRDWRFGLVSIESIVLPTDDKMAGGETSKTGASAAPILGPTFGGAGTQTKAECLSLEAKNTKIGWGVVHFYREGEESPTLDILAQEDDHVQSTAPDNDCTTLCIPAVPAYMTPGDFLGFVGEKWLGDISHCRMVMTSKMNRYLVLLKFRHHQRAKEWRREFDGKIFNTMEVSLTPHSQPLHRTHVE